jgi:hypothetical protein
MKLHGPCKQQGVYGILIRLSGLHIAIAQPTSREGLLTTRSRALYARTITRRTGQDVQVLRLSLRAYRNKNIRTQLHDSSRVKVMATAKNTKSEYQALQAMQDGTSCHDKGGHEQHQELYKKESGS